MESLVQRFGMHPAPNIFEKNHAAVAAALAGVQDARAAAALEADSFSLKNNRLSQINIRR